MLSVTDEESTLFDISGLSLNRWTAISR